jgi:hypothetical protein
MRIWNGWAMPIRSLIDEPEAEMKKSTKALLWSGLVFPGVGHFSLKYYLRGLLWFVPAMLALAVLVQGLIERAEFVMDKIESGAVAADPQAIAALLDRAPDTAAAQIALWVLLACWLAAMVDAYRLGAMHEKDANASK